MRIQGTPRGDDPHDGWQEHVQRGLWFRGCVPRNCKDMQKWLAGVRGLMQERQNGTDVFPNFLVVGLLHLKFFFVGMWT